METTKTYSIPPAFYADHRSRDNGESGRIVRETKRQLVVELDAEAYVDLLTDAELLVSNYDGGAYEGEERQYFGLRSSAVATIRALRADPFSDDEIAAGQAAWDARSAAAIEADKAWQSAYRARVRADAAERERIRLAHPRVKATYVGLAGRIVGLADNVDLGVGTIIVTETLRELEVLELGTEHRGDIQAVIYDRSAKLERPVKLELQRIYPEEGR